MDSSAGASVWAGSRKVSETGVSGGVSGSVEIASWSGMACEYLTGAGNGFECIATVRRVERKCESAGPGWTLRLKPVHMSG
jgi:hypothetical protein